MVRTPGGGRQPLISAFRPRCAKIRTRSPVGAPGRGVGRPILRCATAATYPDARTNWRAPTKIQRVKTETEEACTRRAGADDGFTASRCGLSGTGFLNDAAGRHMVCLETGTQLVLTAATAPLISSYPCCEPTAHRLLFSARSSLSKWRPRPPLHRSANGGPDRHCIAQFREGAFPLITAPAFAVLLCFRLQTSPRATAGGRHAEVATNNE
jgi:hypothetical protein